jgi:hypothetical protein
MRWPAAIVVVAAGVAGCVDSAPVQPVSTAASATELATSGANNDYHDGRFPCSLADQGQVADATALAVVVDAPRDGRSCVYALSSGERLTIAVNDPPIERSTWQRELEVFPAWEGPDELGARALPGLGDRAVLTRTPRYAGQIDIWRGRTLIRIADGVAHRLSPADTQRLISLAHSVLTRFEGLRPAAQAPAAGGSAGQPRGSLTPTTASPGPAGTTRQPCQLLGRADVQAVLGRPYREGYSSVALHSCVFAPAAGSSGGSVILTLLPGDQARTPDDTGPYGYRPINGREQQAARGPDGKSIIAINIKDQSGHYIKEQQVIDIAYTGGDLTADETQRALRILVLQALGQL